MSLIFRLPTWIHQWFWEMTGWCLVKHLKDGGSVYFTWSNKFKEHDGRVVSSD